MDAAARWNVHHSGRPDGPVLLFAHGFGCDQHMWRHVAPAFEDEFHVVLFDLAGSGGSDLASYDHDRYSTLHGHAADLLELCEKLDLHDVTFRRALGGVHDPGCSPRWSSPTSRTTTSPCSR